MSTHAAAPTRQIDPLDYLEIDTLLSDEERLIRDTVRAWVREHIVPNVGEWFEEGILPMELAPELGKLGLLGMHLDGYGLPGASAVAYGLACLELEAGDSGIRSLVSVQGSLSMFAIWRWGSEEQKQQWLPAMAAGTKLGCFGLTEPDAGSDPGAMRTTARRDGSDWILNGSKMWITNGTIADVATVWARTQDGRSEEHTSELQSRRDLVCRLLLEKKKKKKKQTNLQTLTNAIITPASAHVQIWSPHP